LCDWSSALCFLHLLQGRELALALDSTDLSHASDELKHYVDSRVQWRDLLKQLAENTALGSDKAFNKTFYEQQAQLKVARNALIATGEYSAVLQPLEIDFDELRKNLADQQALLLWIGLEKVGDHQVQGVWYIPKVGEPAFIDLDGICFANHSTLSLWVEAVNDLHPLMGGSRLARKAGAPADKAVLTQLHEKYLKESSSHLEFSSIRDLNTATCETIWQLLQDGLGELWATKLLPLVERDKITNIQHLTQGHCHNLPVTLGSKQPLQQQRLPGISVYYQRRLSKLSSTEPFRGRMELHVCPGTADDFPIVHTVFEQEAITALLQMDADENTSSPTVVGHQDKQFPHGSESMPTHVHLACHGKRDKQSQAVVLQATPDQTWGNNVFENIPTRLEEVFIAACIAGEVKDDTDGNPYGLSLAFMRNSYTVVASTLPVFDRYISWLVVMTRAYQREGYPINEALQKAKLDLLTGKWHATAEQVITQTYVNAIAQAWAWVETQEGLRNANVIIINQLEKCEDPLFLCFKTMVASNTRLPKDASRWGGIINNIISQEKAHISRTDDDNRHAFWIDALVHSLDVFA
jgi:hypothetical protein